MKKRNFRVQNKSFSHGNFSSKNHRGQIQMSFGMIFSILLIIIFIGFAIYAINQFLSLQNSIKINTFYDTLQNDVNTVWNAAQASQVRTYDVPTYIKQICFTNSGSQDLIIYGDSSRPIGSHSINNLNISAMTSGASNPCFNAVNGRIEVTLKKSFSDTMVTIQ